MEETAITKENKIMIKSSQIGYGDIVVESVQVTTGYEEERVEVARYIIVGKLIEKVIDRPMQLKEFETVYFKVIMLYINKETNSIWARDNNPGSRYLLSEHEITNYHDWSFSVKLDLTWPSGSIEVEESGVKWDYGGW